MKTNIEANEYAINTNQYKEWLKNTVKNIVESKPEISDENLLDLVDEMYGDVFFYDNSKFKVEVVGKELFKYFKKMNPRGTSRHAIRKFIDTVLSLKAQYRI